MRSHLSNDEIEQLFFSSGEPASSAGLAEARAHLEGCGSCQELARRHQEAAAQLKQLRAPGASRPTKDCPPASVWAELAAGGCKAGDAEEWMLHASQCGYCGPLLKDACSDEAPALSAEEESVLRGLKTSNPEWQADFARHLAATGRPQPVRGRLLDFPRLAWVAGLAAVLAIAAWFGVQQWRGSDVDTLLAKAAEERRPSEARYPGAAFSEPKVERGAESSSMDLPQALLDAKALIARHLHDSPDDPKWLQAKARADLLEYHHDAAIESLKLALESQPDSPSVLTDIGIAYYQRAISTDTALDYGNAVESFSRALAKKPDDPVALYNRALAEEKLFLYEGAIADWEHYLRVESNGPWAEQAHKHLEDLQRKKREHTQGLALPWRSPAEFNRHVTAADPQTWGPADARVEDYLEVAILEWLPEAHATTPIQSSDAHEASLALANLAVILRTNHQDAWLSEVLREPFPQGMPEGFAELSRSLQEELAGEPDAIIAHARAAEMAFASSGGHSAAWLRAKLEEVYGIQRSFEGDRCLKEVAGLRRQLSGRSYRWMEAQLLLEESNCRAAVAESDAAIPPMRAALQLARASDYRNLTLRAVGLQAGLANAAGDAMQTWHTDVAGLAEYWQGPPKPLRGFQFYDDLNISAFDRNLPWLAVQIEREAVWAVELSGNRTNFAMALVQLSKCASRLHLREEADAALRRADVLFQQFAPSQATLTFWVEGEGDLARLEVDGGQLDAAAARLDRLRSVIPALRSYDVALGYYLARGELHLAQGHSRDAETALDAAVQLSEWALAENSQADDRLRRVREKAGAYKDLVSLRLQENDPVGALELWEWYRAAAVRVNPSAPNEQFDARFAALAQRSELPVLPKFGSELQAPAEGVVLSYAVLPEGPVLWSASRAGVRFHRIDMTLPRLEQVSRRFAAECSDPKSDLTRLHRDGRLLYDALVAPAAGEFQGFRALAVEADGPVSALSFEALTAADGQYLSDHFAITYSPGMLYQHALRPVRPLGAQTRALVAAAPRAGKLPVLVDAGREAHQVVADFPQSTLLLGTALRSESLLHDLSEAELLHFAGHTQTSAGHVWLLLGTDGDGKAVRFDPLSIPAGSMAHIQLVVLSACSTASGDQDVTFDPDSAVHAFLRAGVPQVLATRWEVDSAATADLMAGFDQRLAAGALPAVALREAAAQLRRIPAFEHPYYWAAGGLFGAVA